MERMNGKKEVRTGNFFLTHENGKVTFRDLSGNVTFAVSDKYPVGMMFSMAMEDKANEDFIHNYVAVLSNALCVVPDREYLKAFYLRADLFVFPSVFDTASLCPIEAAAFGLPALLVEGSPTAEIVKDGFSGYTAPAEPHAWAERIHAALSDRAAHERVRGNCRRHVYRSWKDVVAEVEAEYDRLLTT